MKIQELRIGNYVNFKNRTDIDYCEVTALDFGGYVHVLRNFKDKEGDDDQPENIKDITPINITEQMLIKFGFKKTNDLCFDYPSKFGKWRIRWSSIMQEIHALGIHYSDEPENTVYNFRWNIKYVHELQNLIFVLTGSELTLNNK